MGVAGQAEVEETFAAGHHKRRSAVAEEHRGGAVVPVAETRRLLGRDDQDVPGAPRLEERVGHVEGIDQTGAGPVHIERRAAAAQLAENDAAQRRGNVAVGHIRTNQVIYVSRCQTGRCNRFLRGFQRQFPEGLRAQKPARADSGTGGDPIVAGIQKSGQHIVGNHLLGKRTACSYNSHMVLFRLIFVHLAPKTDCIGSA